ncbi:Transportin-3 [Phytophthora boehmeriae]|uniref:Transportin-3 n=1 Tax=Phytophthora boehmeriae TaxID=109152 RepID=A0A8T1WZ79_9STRA|nr:Transportin-3 [Phytophthora boehmeriae]
MIYKLGPDALSLDGIGDQTGDLPDFHSEQLKPGHHMDDVDLNFLTELLQQEDDAPVLPPAQPPRPVLPAGSGHSSPSSACSSDARDETNSSGEDESSPKEKLSESNNAIALVDEREMKRKSLGAKNARLYRSRKKSKLMDLKEQVRAFQGQLDALRLKHNVTRANSAIAQWEEKAIALRIKRRQAESINEQLQQALLVQTGVVCDLRSIFTDSAPPSAALNMRHFLHSYTHLRKDRQSRTRDLELVGSDAKMDRAMRVVLRETQTIATSLSPEILFQELDLGTEGLGKTSTAVYAFNTRDANKAFQVACQTIFDCCGVWPDYSRIASSMKFVDVPPTKHHVRYGITQHTYRHNFTEKQISSEARDLYYSRMTGSCGVLVWDFVDDDDLYPLKSGTLIKRNTVGALVMRPETCQDGVERMVCRSICTDMQILRGLSSLSLNVAEFALLEDMMVFEAIKEKATDWNEEDQFSV